jgi:signal recognition particle subunit SEC65
MVFPVFLDSMEIHEKIRIFFIRLRMSSSSASNVLLKGDVVLGKGAETTSPEDYKSWQCNYIDKSKSVKQGRRVSVCKAVDRPSLGEIVEALQLLGIPYVIENKAYPRDWLIRGRVRVNLSVVSDESMNTSKLYIAS